MILPSVLAKRKATSGVLRNGVLEIDFAPPPPPEETAVDGEPEAAAEA
jgi:hypothetical protein